MDVNIWRTVIRRMAPNATPKIVSMVADHANDVFAQNGIVSMRRQASILAHMCVETGGFRTLEENLNYSAPRLMQVWPKRFPTIEIAQQYAHDPKKLANKVYGKRMGNTPGTDDGWVFRGQGLLQVTGRDNVTRLANRLGVTPETAANWLIDPDHALECAAQTYNMLGVGPYADRGDMVGQTKRINGGLNGLNERKSAFNKAMRVLAQYAAPTILGQHSDVPSSDEEMENITADKLRANNSRTIKEADSVKKSTVGVVGAATAALSTSSDTLSQLQTVSDGINSGRGIIEVLSSNWQVFLVIASVAAIGYFAWSAWNSANNTIAARVNDARTGANLSR